MQVHFVIALKSPKHIRVYIWRTTEENSIKEEIVQRCSKHFCWWRLHLQQQKPDQVHQWMVQLNKRNKIPPFSAWIWDFCQTVIVKKLLPAVFSYIFHCPYHCTSDGRPLVPTNVGFWICFFYCINIAVILFKKTLSPSPFWDKLSLIIAISNIKHGWVPCKYMQNIQLILMVT